MKQFYTIFLFLISFYGNANQVDSLIQALDDANLDSEKVSLYHKISWELRVTDPNMALEYALNGYNLAHNIEDLKGKESCVNNIGVIYAMKGDYDSSIASFNENLDLNKELKSYEGEATANNNLGLVYYYKGDYSKAVEHYMKSLKIYDELGDSNGKASAYNNLGLIYENKEDFKKAIYYQKLALKMRLELGSSHHIAYSYGNIGNIFYIKEQSDSALFYFLKAEKLFKEVNDVHSLGTLVGNVGKIYENENDFTKAEEYYKQAIEIQEKIDDGYGLAVNYLNLSEVNAKKENFFLAITLGEKGIKLADKIGAKSILKQGYSTLRNSYSETGQFEKAFEYSEKLMIIKDSLFSEEKHKKIAELETKYSTEQKEKENELLRQSNTLNELKLDRSRILNYGVSGILVGFTIFGMFIYRGYSQKKKALLLLEDKNKEVVKQKDIIERKNNDILDSLNYAKRIQYAILPPKSYVDDLLPDSFIFYRPKDIVSGDFYWVEKYKDNVLFSAVDCTGHGVPGAFMSIVGYNGLNQALLLGEGKPSMVLDSLNELVSNTLHQTQNTEIKEGMDIGLCSVNFKTKILEYSGAYNSLYIVRNNEIIELKGDRFSIGSKHYRQSKSFENHKIELQKSDMIFMTTDGYTDQFGGANGKKFKIVNFRKLLLEIASKSTNTQKEILESTIDDWRASEEQVDDICVIGVRV